MPSDRGVLRDRLNKVQKAVRQAQQESWKHQNPSALSGSSSKSASFALGLTLFREDVETVEQNIRERLEDVEAELSKLSMEAEPNDFLPQDSQDSSQKKRPMSAID